MTQVTAELLRHWADKIDQRLGPIPGRDADRLAIILRAAAGQLALFDPVALHRLPAMPAPIPTGLTPDETMFRIRAIANAIEYGPAGYTTEWFMRLAGLALSAAADLEQLKPPLAANLFDPAEASGDGVISGQLGEIG